MPCAHHGLRLRKQYGVRRFSVTMCCRNWASPPPPPGGTHRNTCSHHPQLCPSIQATMVSTHRPIVVRCLHGPTYDGRVGGGSYMAMITMSDIRAHHLCQAVHLEVYDIVRREYMYMCEESTHFMRTRMVCACLARVMRVSCAQHAHL